MKHTISGFDMFHRFRLAAFVFHIGRHGQTGFARLAGIRLQIPSWLDFSHLTQRHRHTRIQGRQQVILQNGIIHLPGHRLAIQAHRHGLLPFPDRPYGQSVESPRQRQGHHAFVDTQTGSLVRIQRNINRTHITIAIGMHPLQHIPHAR